MSEVGPAQVAPRPDRRPRVRSWMIVVAAIGIALFVYLLTLTTLLNADRSIAPTPTSTSASDATPSGPVTYTSDEYEFSIVFPGEPIETTSTQAVMDLDVEVLQVQWATENAAYTVAAARLPGSFESAAIESALQASLDGAAAANGGTLSGVRFYGEGDDRFIWATLSFPDLPSNVVAITIRDHIQYSLIAQTANDLGAFMAYFRHPA